MGCVALHDTAHLFFEHEWHAFFNHESHESHELLYERLRSFRVFSLLHRNTRKTRSIFVISVLLDVQQINREFEKVCDSCNSWF